MLDEAEIEKIKKLINQGKTNYKISIELRHSPNTIKKIREEYKKTKVSHKKDLEMYFKNPVDKVREEIKNIENIIETEQLKAEVRKELVKLLESLREILKTEVDERIDGEKANATEERDKQWQDFLNQKYVKKEIVIDLNKRIKEMETTIINLRNENKDKDALLRNNQYEMSQLKASNQREKKDLENQIGDLLWENIGLKEENGDLHDYIGNYLDDAGRWERENLRHEEEVLNGKKADFDRFVKRQQSNLDGLFFELDEKLKSVEKREDKLAEQKEKLKKREDEFDNNTKQIYGMLEERIKSVEKREGKLAEGEKGKSLFENYMHSGCRPKNEQPKCVTLIPVLYSGEPVIQSGFSQVIQSGGEPMIVMSGLEPVVQSGFPSIIQSGEETKVVESSGGNMIQSGYSPNYYFGTKNLDKTSKKAGKVSS